MAEPKSFCPLQPPSYLSQHFLPIFFFSITILIFYLKFVSCFVVSIILRLISTNFELNHKHFINIMLLDIDICHPILIYSPPVIQILRNIPYRNLKCPHFNAFSCLYLLLFCPGNNKK